MTDTPETELSGDLAWALEAEARVWAIRPELLTALTELHRKGASLEAMRESASDFLGLDVEAAEAARRPTMRDSGGGAVAVLPLKGVITPNVSLLALIFGLGSGLQSFREGLRASVANDEIDTIVLDIDSPGGVVDLVPETAAEIRAANAQKPVVAVANTMAASAAYWIASQASELVVTPSGEVGSIGVFATHWDFSQALEEAGERPTLISAGKYKVETNPYEPLGDEAKQALQQGVDDYYGLFVKDVAKGRDASVSDVKSGYGEGRVLTAKRAVEAGLADRVETLDSVIGRLTSSGGSSARALIEDERPEVETTEGDTEKVAYTSDELRRVVDTLAAPQP